MRERIKTIWQHHRFLLIGFVAAVLLTLFFTIKTIGDVAYWSKHRDATLEPWMTIGYIGHSYMMDPKIIVDALGIDRTDARHKSIEQLARDAGMDYSALQTEILTIIDNTRRAND